MADTRKTRTRSAQNDDFIAQGRNPCRGDCPYKNYRCHIQDPSCKYTRGRW